MGLAEKPGQPAGDAGCQLARLDGVVLVPGGGPLAFGQRPWPRGNPMKTLTLVFDSLWMEERTGSDWSENRHFYSSDVWLESGMLELETGEVLGGNLGNESSITASLYFHLQPKEPVKVIPAKSTMRYFPFIEYNGGDGGIGPFLGFDIIASPSTLSRTRYKCQTWSGARKNLYQAGGG